MFPSVALAQSGERIELTDEEMENIVRRSYQYVAVFNVINNFALNPDNPMTTGGFNRVFANTSLADHTLQAIARPNNDTLYVIALMDVSEEAMVVELPAFDSSYVSMMVTGYDHYTEIPLSTIKGDFEEPTNVLFYSARTPGYDGKPVEGVDVIMETTGDFLSAVLRVMPHSAEATRLEHNLAAMRRVDVELLSEFLGQGSDNATVVPWGSPPAIERNIDLRQDNARFPPFGSDFEIFEDRFIEVMQFVVNHATLDPNDELDVELLEALAPLGIAPGTFYDPETAPEIDETALRQVAQRVATGQLELFSDPDFIEENVTQLFQPKGSMPLDLVLLQSVIGPLGLPAQQALYPNIAIEDGEEMNAMYDSEIVMTVEDLPPANAFWSVTLYENETGFFIPNEQFKYSVGENAGYQLDENGGIRIVVAAEQPDDVPAENWLPINRADINLDTVMRIYAPDLDRYADWTAPIARKLN